MFSRLRRPLFYLSAAYLGFYALSKVYTYEQSPLILKMNLKRNMNFQQHYYNLKAIDIAKNSPNVIGIIGKYDASERLGVATTQEIRNSITDFNNCGKLSSLFFDNHIVESQLIQYYLASAFSLISVSTPSIWNLTPNSYENFFFSKLLKKIGVDVHVEKRKDYKTFFNMIDEDKITDPHRESILSIDQSILNQLISGISEKRNISFETATQMILRGFFSEKEAHENNLIDLIGSYRTLKVVIKEKLSLLNHLKIPIPSNRMKIVDLDDYSNYQRLKQLTKSYSSKIAVIEYDDDCKKILKKIKQMKSIEAVVIRIDSNGGTFQTFQKILDEVKDLKNLNKKVIISFGDVAASGGYMAACQADKIVSNPGTITGSIGVVSAIPNIQGLLNKIGVDVDIIRDDLSSISFVRPMNQNELEGLKYSTDIMYDTFKAYVSEGRGLTKEHVEEIAQGKIYTGEQAMEIGLVDQLGGINDAVNLARELIGDPDAHEYLFESTYMSRVKSMNYSVKIWGMIKSMVEETNSIGTIQVKENSIRTK